jgi:hypothetical protein
MNYRLAPESGTLPRPGWRELFWDAGS